MLLLVCRVLCFAAGGGKGEGGGDGGCEGSGGSAGEGEEADASSKGPPPSSCCLSARICPGPCGQMSDYVHWGWRRPVSLEFRGERSKRARRAIPRGQEEGDYVAEAAGVGPLESPAGEAAAAPDQDEEGERVVGVYEKQYCDPV